MHTNNEQGHWVPRAFSGLFAMVMLAASTPASATVVSAAGTVAMISTYGDFGSGDFVFRLSSYVAGCEGGFWIAPSQPGFKTLVAAVMQARATGESITVGGDNTQIWNGSGSSFCKVNWLNFY